MPLETGSAGLHSDATQLTCACKLDYRRQWGTRRNSLCWTGALPLAFPCTT